MTFGKKILGEDGIFPSAAEAHAFLIGISEVVAFWPPRHKVPHDYEANGNPFKEYHYYGVGRLSGVIVWCIIISVMCLILKAIWT